MSNQSIHAAADSGQNPVQPAAAPVLAAAIQAPQHTTAPITVAAPVPSASGIEAEFVAMPGPGQVCPYSNLKRGALYALCRDGLIQTVSLRREGTTRGRRLIVLTSLKAYLRGLNALQNGGNQ